MGHMRVGIQVVSCLWLLCWSLASTAQSPSQGTDGAASAYTAQNASLSAEQVAKRLQEKNAQRAAALGQFNGTRIYRMRYTGFPSERGAEMVVNVAYRAPNTKTFSVVSQSGSKFIQDRVFKKLLEGEQEAGNEDNR